MSLLSLEMLLDTVHLPTGCRWYESGGQREFAIYRDGLVSTTTAAWIIKPKGEKWLGCGVFFSLGDKEQISTELIQSKVNQAIPEMQEFEDGGLLPMPEN